MASTGRDANSDASRTGAGQKTKKDCGYEMDLTVGPNGQGTANSGR